MSNLDDHPYIRKITGFLRSKPSGRLDAKKVAALYGEDLKRFAKALDVSPSALGRSPFARKYQAFLVPFVQTARIIPMLENRKQFAVWAKTPNKELGGITPLEILFSGPASVRKLVETVEDVLVGEPE